MIRRRLPRGWALLLALALLLAGCWDRREIEERSNSLATGVDLCTEEEDCTLVVTRQIAIPGQIPQGSAGGGGGGDGDTVYVVRSPGRDGPDTAAHAQSLLQRKLNFGHTRVLIWSEEFARQGLDEYIDYVRRVSEVRRLMWIGISEGRAEDLMRAKPPLERVPALYLNDMLDDAVKTGRLPETFLGDFLVRFSNEGEEAIAPLFRMAGPDRPQLAGLAVFRKMKMVGKLTPEETVTYMELRGLGRGAELLSVDLPGGGFADIRVYGRRTNYQISGGASQLSVRLQLEMETDLIQLHPKLDSSDPAVLDRVEKAAGEEVTRRSYALIEKLQTELGADILAVGERVRASKPQVWRAIKDWPATFCKVQFLVEVKIHVRRSGMGTD